MALARLERDGLLQSQGQYRSKVYHLPGAAPVSPEQVFAAGLSSVPNAASSVPKGLSSVPNGSSSIPSDTRSGLADATAGTAAQVGQQRDPDGCLVSPHLDAPIVDSLAALSPALRLELEARASLPRQKERLSPDEMKAAILSVCKGRYLRLNVLAELVNRNADSLRRKYLDELVKTQRVRRAFPATPTHEMQSYRTEEVE